MTSLPPKHNWTRRELADLLGGELAGPDGAVRSLRDPAEAGQADAVVARSPKYMGACLASHAGLVVLGRWDPAPPEDGRALLLVPDPDAAWGALLEAFAPALERAPGVDPHARVHPEATLGPDIHVGPFAVVARGAVVGAGSTVMAGAYVGEGSSLGEGCLLHPNATVLHGVSLGRRVIVHSGAVIGGEGFGYRRRPEGGYAKLPHIGTTVLEDDVEVFSNAVIDRGTVRATRIGRGTKIGHCCIVAHNSQIGENVLMVGAVQMAGSVVVEDNVTLLGQVGVVDHARIGEGATVLAQSGVKGELPPGGTYIGAPARPAREMFRLEGHLKNLDTTIARLRALEAEVKALRAAVGLDPGEAGE